MFLESLNDSLPVLDPRETLKFCGRIPGASSLLRRILNRSDHIRRKYTNEGVSAMNRVLERGISFANSVQKALRIRASITFAVASVPNHMDTLRAEASLWAVACMRRPYLMDNPQVESHSADITDDHTPGKIRTFSPPGYSCQRAAPEGWLSSCVVLLAPPGFELCSGDSGCLDQGYQSAPYYPECDLLGHQRCSNECRGGGERNTRE